MSNKKGAAEAAPQNSYIDSITKHAILSILEEAKEPIMQDEMLSILHSRGIKASKRDLRRVRESLVKDGVPVCSSSQRKGYWIATNEKEKELAIKDLKAKAEAMLTSARALAKINVEEYWND